MIADMPARNLGPASPTSRLRACKRFASWLGRSLETVSPDDVKHFQQHLIESGTSICTRSQTMTGVKFLFRVTLRRHDLAAEVFRLKEPVKVPLVLSRNEVRRILAMAPGLKARVMLSLAYGCGMRAGEAVRLKVGDSVPEARLRHGGEQKIIRIVQAKGRKDRNMMLPGDILGLLREWWTERPASQNTGVPGPERVLFPGYRGKHLSARQISRLFKQAAGGRRDYQAGDAAHVAPFLCDASAGRFEAGQAQEGQEMRVIARLAPITFGRRGYLPHAWCCLAGGQCGPYQPRSVEGDERHRALPHGGARRSCRAM